MKWKCIPPCVLALAIGAAFWALDVTSLRSVARPLVVSARKPGPPPSAGVSPAVSPFGGPNRSVDMRARPAMQPGRNLSLPMSFEPNLGQADPQIQFIGRGRGLTALANDDGIKVDAGSQGSLRISFLEMHGSGSRGGTALEMNWRGDQRVRGVTNYLIGNDPRRWRTDVPHFSKLAGAAEDGVAISLYGDSNGLEYDLLIPPGMNSSGLRVALDGAQGIHLRANGDLAMHVGTREFTMRKPNAYQNYETSSAMTRHSVRAEYLLESNGSIGFRLGPYDIRKPLVIDPSLSVTYATFLGGTGNDNATSMALDSTGNVYVSGTTNSSTTFPEGSGHRIGPADGPTAFFIAKIDPTLTGANSLIHLTFLGGSGQQNGGLIAVDASGDVAITGTTTATDYPVTDTSTPTNGLTTGFGNDTVVSEINPAGTGFVFSTIFGGSGAQSLNGAGGIALDSSGDVYISSDTNTTQVDTASADLPVTPNPGAYQTTWDGQPSDGFLAIFTPPAQAPGAATLKYCSYLDTNVPSPPIIGGIAVDQTGNAYIAGSVGDISNGFPTKNAFQATYGGGAFDAFVMKMSPLGGGANDLVYATLLGGASSDQAFGIAVDTQSPPDAYVTGATQSANFPTNGSKAGFQPSLHSSAETSTQTSGFLAVLGQGTLSGQTFLAYSTYIGGSYADSGQSVAVTAPNSVYIAGSATSFDFPWKDNLQPFNGAADAFVAKFDPTSAGVASLLYATPLAGTSPAGGSASSSATAIASDGTGHAYVAGVTTSGDFPTAVTTDGPVNGFQQSCSSCTPISPANDAFIAEIAESAALEPSITFTLPKVVFTATSGNAPQFAGILNRGEAGLTISNISIIGPNAADFSLSGQTPCLNSTIEPSLTAQCSFEISFTPTQTGPEIAALSVTDNAPGSPQVLELDGLGGTGPSASVSPPSINFGNQPQNTTAPNPTVVTLSNVGGQTLTISGMTLNGADPTQFKIAGAPTNGTPGCVLGTGITGGSSCGLQIAFAPTAQGSFQAQLVFTDNSGGVENSQQTVTLTGAGIAPSPLASVAPQSLSFGNETVGASSVPQTTTLTNTGSTALSITSIALAGTNPADFAIASSSNPCPASGGTVAINASCTVAVQFSPQSAGSKNAILSFTDNAGTGQQVALSGTATAATAPQLSASPASLTFAAQSIGTVSASQTVTVSNTGSSSSGIGTVSATDPSEFTVNSSCAPTLAAGKTCAITVAFAPNSSAAAGPRAATLSIGGATPPTVSLSGIATQAAISVPPSVNFGSQLAGTAGATVPVVITNSSSGAYAGALSISSVSINESGATAGDFAVSNNGCVTTSTPPGGTCTIQMAFQPASACPTITGARSATLVLNDNTPGSPHSISLGGTAVDFCVNAAPGQGISEPILAGSSETFNLEIQSSDATAGSAQLACSVPSTMIPATCSVSPATVQISSATPGAFALTVSTTAPTPSVRVSSSAKLVPPTSMLGALALVAGFALVLIALACALPLTLPRRATRIREFALAGLGVAALACFAACGGGNSDPATATLGTPPGSYTVTVTATITVGTAPALTRTLTVPITVQAAATSDARTRD